jgi:hypothetical protein
MINLVLYIVLFATKSLLSQNKSATYNSLFSGGIIVMELEKLRPSRLIERFQQIIGRICIGARTFVDSTESSRNESNLLFHDAGLTERNFPLIDKRRAFDDGHVVGIDGEVLTQPE